MNNSHFSQALFVSEETTRLNEVFTLANHCCVGSMPTSLGLMLFKPSCHQTCNCAVRVAGPANGSLNNVKWMIVFFITSRILPGTLRILDWLVKSEPGIIPVIVNHGFVCQDFSERKAGMQAYYTGRERF
jgi:hypothetical protein